MTGWAHAQQPALSSPVTSSVKGVELKGKAPVNRELLKVKLPRPQEATLANGLQIALLEDHKLPTFSLQIIFRGGGLADPSDRHGIAMITAAMMDEGTRTLNSREIAERLGRQVLVLSVDARRTPSGTFEVTTHGGRRGTGIDAVEWAHRAAELGVGEILLNSMDADGTKDGYDLEMIRAVRKHVTVPVIASGGAGRLTDFPPAVEAGADAVLAASVFHFGDLRIGEVKETLREAGHPVR